MRSQQISAFLDRHPRFLPALFALLFVAITLPGIQWGSPAGWNPDELIQRVINALHGEWVFDEINFDYPSLPKYAMYWLGRLALSWGASDAQVMVAARGLSVLLGALVVYLTYRLAQGLGASRLASSFAALFVITSSELAQHSRFAHNDIYLTLFTLTVALFCLQYAKTRGRGWFYLACLFVGLAASSKYNGISMGLASLILFALVNLGHRKEDRWRPAETLVAGILLIGLGYAIGTPKALLWMSFYFKRMVPAFLAHASYGFTPDSQIGLIGQWSQMLRALGSGLFVLGAVGLGYSLYRFWGKSRLEGIPAALPWLVLPLVVLSQNLPTILSYNYPMRFFLPLLPLMAVLAAISIDWVLDRIQVLKLAQLRPAVIAALVVILAYSAARVVGIALLFQHDARQEATQFLAALPAGQSIEYTYYPPVIDREHFDPEHTHNYPVYFVSDPDEAVPTSPFYEFNLGAAGIEYRQPHYLVVDSFTYQRFYDERVCELNAADCDFILALLAGETEYDLIGQFAYALPDWIPEVSISFLNPEIRVYERGD